MRKSVSACQHVPTVSFENAGSTCATHSLQPTAPSASIRQRMGVRCLSTPKLVSNGFFSGSRSRNSSDPLDPHLELSVERRLSARRAGPRLAPAPPPPRSVAAGSDPAASAGEAPNALGALMDEIIVVEHAATPRESAKTR